MPKNLRLQNRRSIRLKEFDYSSPGAYFITISTQNNESRFGNIEHGLMKLNAAGEMIDRIWQSMPERFKNLVLDEYAIMPTHFHAVMMILDVPDKDSSSVGAIVGAFKSITTVEYIRGINEHLWRAFNQRLWQRNYYEKIIRSEIGLEEVRKYIQVNALAWTLDNNAHNV